MMKRTLVAHFVVLALAVAAALRPADSAAQDLVAPAAADDGLVTLDGLIRRTEAHLHSLPALEVVAQQTWTADGQATAKGGCQFTLRTRHDGPFRLEIRSVQTPPVTLTCVGDGQQITRTYDNGRQRLVSREDGAFADLAADHLTASCLVGSGLDLLCQPRLHAHVLSRVSDVRFLGAASLPQGEAHHFRCTWEGSSLLELWISAGDDPLLLRQTRTVATDDVPDQQLVIVTDYAWRRPADLPPETFRLETPDDFVRVTDLYSYLLDGAVQGAVGRELPGITLRDTTGQPHHLNELRGRDAVCLFFWTTWATASAEQKVEVHRLMDDFKNDPVAFYAVNVGEPKDAVAAFIEQTGFSGIVLLDADRELTHALRVTSLPVCVLVGKDGKIAAVHVGNTAEDRNLVRRDLAEIIRR
jgi:peroxiredoxin